MNSGELGSASEAAEVSVEVSECTLRPFHFTPAHNRSEITEEATLDLAVLADDNTVCFKTKMLQCLK